jgi:NDP-sugar pyrophosphorylase family protein
MPLAGRPLLEWTLSWLKEHDVTECVINLHYLQEQVKDFIGDGSRFGMAVHYSFEPVLLGTAGAIKKVADLFDEPFYMIYGDNFSQWDLGYLKSCFDDWNAAAPMAVMAVHWRDDVTHSGMIDMAKNGRIRRIVEKPQAEEVTSHYVNAGFFYMHPRILEDIPAGKYCDFSYDVFPALLRRGECLFAVKMDEPIIGIDDPDAYERANQLAAKILSEKNHKGK